jgi:hypothetical protein
MHDESFRNEYKRHDVSNIKAQCQILAVDIPDALEVLIPLALHFLNTA